MSLTKDGYIIWLGTRVDELESRLKKARSLLVELSETYFMCDVRAVVDDVIKILYSNKEVLKK